MAEAVTGLDYRGNAQVSDLTSNGAAVTIGPLSVTMAGNDLAASQAECQLGRGANTPAGTSDTGWVDTTYTLTPAQVQAGSLMGA